MFGRSGVGADPPVAWYIEGVQRRSSTKNRAQCESAVIETREVPNLFFRATKIRVLALHGSVALPISFQRLSKR